MSSDPGDLLPLILVRRHVSSVNKFTFLLILVENVDIFSSPELKVQVSLWARDLGIQVGPIKPYSEKMLKSQKI